MLTVKPFAVEAGVEKVGVRGAASVVIVVDSVWRLNPVLVTETIKVTAWPTFKPRTVIGSFLTFIVVAVTKRLLFARKLLAGFELVN